MQGLQLAEKGVIYGVDRVIGQSVCRGGKMLWMSSKNGTQA